MLIYFRIRNFKSIVDTTIDMRYGEGKAPNGYREAEDIPFLECRLAGGKNIRLAPILTIYGQNASGKSNLAEAVDTLTRCVRTGKLYYHPNCLHPELSESTFEICFVSERIKYTYILSYNRILLPRAFSHRTVSD